MKWSLARRYFAKSSRARSSRFSPLSVEVEALEIRLVLSAAFDVTDLTALRNLPQYADIDGALPDGTKIGIAVIDSGVLGSHADLQSNFVAFFDAVSTDANADGRVTPATSESAIAAFDPNGHGTHVSGTAASSNPNIGVATKAGLIGIRGLPGPGESFPQHDTLLSALQWVEENHQRYNIKVVNMSIQNGTNLNAMPNANDFARQIDVLETLGITVVSASGNAYADYVALGASFPAVFSSLSVANTWEDNGVGDVLPALGAGPRPQFVAIDRAPTADQLAASSQRSTLSNQVAAPGSTIFSTWNDGGYNTISGTSMSSPFVAGLVALVQDAAFTFGGRYLSVNEVVSILRDTADIIFDAQNPNTQRAPLIRNPNGSLSLGQIEDLLESEENYLRVNALNAVAATELLVGQNNNSENGDTNNDLESAIPFPPLNGTQEYTISGNIGADGSIQIGPDDVDLFRIEIESPGVLRVKTERVTGSPDTLDPYLRIFDANGSEIAAQNNKSNGDLYPELLTEALSPGTYYVGLSSFANTAYNPNSGLGTGGNSVGDYQFTVTLINPDPDGVVQGAMEVDLTSPNAINPNSNLVNQGVYVVNRFLNQEIGGATGAIAVIAPEDDPDDILITAGLIQAGPEDVDFFRIVAPDTGKLFIEIDTAAYGGNGVDSFLRVFEIDEQGNLDELGSNDNAGGSSDSFLEIDTIIGRTYFIGVSSSGNQNYDPMDPFGRTSTNDDAGKYDLFLSFFNGDVNGTAFGAVDFRSFDLDLDGVVNGVIGADFGTPLLGANNGFKDVDFFLYTATQDGLLDISVIASQSSLNPLNGVIGVWDLAPSQTDIIQIVDTSSTQPRSIVEVAAGQTLWISVTGLGNHGFNWAATGSGTGGDTGEYQLAIQERPLGDLATLTNNSIAQNTPTPVLLNQLVNETIGSDGQTFLGADDVDIFTYTAVVHQIVVIRTFSDQEDSADTFLRVFNAQGQELAFNNDANAGTKGSQVTIVLNAGQTYYIGVNGNSASAGDYNPLTGWNASPGSVGNYSLLITELPPPIYAAGADAGGGPHIRVFDARNNEELASLFAYNPAFSGGVRVAVGDVTGDGIDDVITAPGPGGGPHIRVLDGATLQFREEPQYNFLAYSPGLTTGWFVAVGDVNNDGFEDIIVTPDANSSPSVKVFSGKTGELLYDFFAYSLGVSGGVRVAAGDVNGDGFADIITVPGPGFPPNVRVFDGRITHTGMASDMSQTESPGLRIGTFFAFNVAFLGGGYVAAGDINGDNLADVIVGAGPGGGPNVQVYNAANTGPFLLDSFFAYAVGFTGGVRVGVSEFNLDNHAEIVTAPGPGGGPHVRLFDDQPASQNVSNIMAFGAFTGGVFVAGSGQFKFLQEAQSLVPGVSQSSATVSSLMLSDLQDLPQAAIGQLADTGLSPALVEQLQNVHLVLADLPGQSLEISLPGRSLLDATAANISWFINPTPPLDEGFAPNTSGTLSRISQVATHGDDLLSVLLHDFNHRLGVDDVDAGLLPDHLMADTLAPEQRRVPQLTSLDALFAEHELLADVLESAIE